MSKSRFSVEQLEATLAVHCLQKWLGLSDPAMEEALYDMPMYHEMLGSNCKAVSLTALTFGCLAARRSWVRSAFVHSGFVSLPRTTTCRPWPHRAPPAALWVMVLQARTGG